MQCIEHFYHCRILYWLGLIEKSYFYCFLKRARSLKLDVFACSVTEWCPTLCDPRDCSPPGPSVHGILWAEKFCGQIFVQNPEWMAISSCRWSSWLRDWTRVSFVFSMAWKILYCWATWEASICDKLLEKPDKFLHIEPV